MSENKNAVEKCIKCFRLIEEGTISEYINKRGFICEKCHRKRIHDYFNAPLLNK